MYILYYAISFRVYDIDLLTDNLAFDSSMLFNSNGNEHPSLATDGNITSCVTTSGAEVLVQVDLKEISIVAEIYITLIGKFIISGEKLGGYLVCLFSKGDQT